MASEPIEEIVVLDFTIESQLRTTGGNEIKETIGLMREYNPLSDDETSAQITRTIQTFASQLNNLTTNSRAGTVLKANIDVGELVAWLDS